MRTVSGTAGGNWVRLLAEPRSKWRIVAKDQTRDGWRVMELTFHPDGKCEDPRYEGILMANGEAEEFPLVSKLNPGGATSSTKEPLRHPTMDGDISTFWQTDCKPCAREKAWLGLDIMEVVDVQCFRIYQEGYV